MPLPPLPEPKRFTARAWGLFLGWVSMLPLFITVLIANALQLSSLVFWPFSRRLFRRLNR